MPFVADPAAFLARLGQMVALPPVGEAPLPPDASAVAFARLATACPGPDAWAPGMPLRLPLLRAGVLVATFDAAGRYGCADGSAHCGLALRVVPADPRSDDPVAQAGYLELLEQPPHPPSVTVAHRPATGRPVPPPVPWAPLGRRRLPFVGGDRRRLRGPLAGDADQYRVVELRRHAPLTPPGT